MALTPEEIITNWEAYKKLVRLYIKDTDRASKMEVMFDALEDRFSMTPASSRLSQHYAFHGGLIKHTINVMSLCTKMYKIFTSYLKDVEMPTLESLMFCAAVHDMGKIGDEVDDYYEVETSDWHREKLGRMFNYAEEITYMLHSDRSLYLLQHFGVSVTKEEFQAIRTHDGNAPDFNKSYQFRRDVLGEMLRFADDMACSLEKEEEREG